MFCPYLEKSLSNLTSFLQRLGLPYALQLHFSQHLFEFEQKKKVGREFVMCLMRGGTGSHILRLLYQHQNSSEVEKQSKLSKEEQLKNALLLSKITCRYVN